MLHFGSLGVVGVVPWMGLSGVDAFKNWLIHGS
jgi:hypothetical protein